MEIENLEYARQYNIDALKKLSVLLCIKNTIPILIACLNSSYIIVLYHTLQTQKLEALSDFKFCFHSDDEEVLDPKADEAYEPLAKKLDFPVEKTDVQLPPGQQMVQAAQVKGKILSTVS